MACNCQNRVDQREEVFRLLEVAELRQVAEQATVIPELALSTVRHLEKAERAERLGLGGDIATVYRQAAERDRAQAVRQLQAVIERLDERVSRGDWADLVQRARREFEQHDGPAVVEESKARLRLAMLDMDGFSAEDAAQTVARFDESLDTVQEEGLSGVARLLRESLERGSNALQTPEMGRQPASPQSQNRQFCIDVALYSAAGMLAVCFLVPFCWCCYAPAVFAWLIASLAGCALLM